MSLPTAERGLGVKRLSKSDGLEGDHPGSRLGNDSQRDGQTWSCLSSDPGRIRTIEWQAEKDREVEGILSGMFVENRKPYSANCAVRLQIRDAWFVPWSTARVEVSLLLTPAPAPDLLKL